MQRTHWPAVRERPLGRVGLLHRLVRVDEAETVQLRVDLLDPREAGGDRGDRRKLTRADAPSELGRRDEA